MLQEGPASDSTESYGSALPLGESKLGWQNFNNRIECLEVETVDERYLNKPVGTPPQLEAPRGARFW